jgi:hypothetical protein
VKVVAAGEAEMWKCGDRGASIIDISGTPRDVSDDKMQELKMRGG